MIWYYIIFSILNLGIRQVSALPDEGKWDDNITAVYTIFIFMNYCIMTANITFQESSSIYLYKSLYKGAKVYIKSEYVIYDIFKK